MKTLLMLLVMLFGILSAQDGREIAERANDLQRGFVDETVETTMYLVNANGDTVVRNLKNMTIERENQEDYSIIQFLNPPDVRGTGLLTYQNPAGDDQQWLYLPELRRVKKISSRNKSGAFMGSEFAYEDITGNTIDKFEYAYVEEVEYEGRACYVVNRVPTYKNSGYTTIKSWYEKESGLPVRSEYTDRKKSLLKVLTIHGYQQYDGGAYRASEMRMENLQTKKTSILVFANRELGVGLEEKDFNKRNLQRTVN